MQKLLLRTIAIISLLIFLGALFYYLRFMAMIYHVENDIPVNMIVDFSKATTYVGTLKHNYKTIGGKACILLKVDSKGEIKNQLEDYIDVTCCITNKGFHFSTTTCRISVYLNKEDKKILPNSNLFKELPLGEYTIEVGVKQGIPNLAGCNQNLQIRYELLKKESIATSILMILWLSLLLGLTLLFISFIEPSF